MSQSEKGKLYRILKSAGVKFDRHYREYSTEEFRKAVQLLDPTLLPPPEKIPGTAKEQQAAARAAKAARNAEKARAAQTTRTAPTPPPEVERATVNPSPQSPQWTPPDRIPGVRLNTTEEDEPIRTDENGLVWYQDEILKPGYAKPRARRVLQYTDPGSETRTVQNGQYIESFEVAGTHSRPSEIKVTLPSYQVGIYRDPRFPFKIHVYNDTRGFDLFEVQNYYGGFDLVPTEIKRIYVENVLCYDIRTTIRAIQAEARELQLSNMRGM